MQQMPLSASTSAPPSSTNSFVTWATAAKQESLLLKFKHV